MKKIILLSIRFYQSYISVSLPLSCRFYPTCSEYGYQSVEKHGAAKGLYFTLLRILKCHPFHEGGFDPVK